MKKESGVYTALAFLTLISMGILPKAWPEPDKNPQPPMGVADIFPERMPGWKPFVSKNFKYEIDVPSNWTAVSEQSEQRKQDRIFRYPNLKIPVIVVRAEAINPTSGNRLQNEITRREKEDFDLVSESEVTIANEKANVLRFSNGLLDITSVLFFAEGQAWSIFLGTSSLAPEKEKNAMDRNFRFMLKSWRLVK